MNFLQLAAQAQLAQSTTLISLLESQLAQRVPARTHKNIHVSALTKDKGFCAREYVLMDILNVKQKDEFISTAMQVAFDNGNALHDLLRNKWLEKFIVGDWECIGCGSQIFFSKKPKTVCIKCKAFHLWRYKECVFVDPLTLVTGSVDAIVDIGEPRHIAVEVKSVDKDIFADLKAPMGEHLGRTQTYLRLLARSMRKESEYINWNQARVLYISKGYGKKIDNGTKILPFKEFVVERNDELADEYLSDGGKVTAYRKNKGQMPKGICATAYDKRCKSCAVSKECFSGLYPAGE